MNWAQTPAFLAAWGFWVSSWVAQAAVAIAAASALSWIDPKLAGPGFVAPAAILFVAGLTAINALGARASGAMALVTVAIKLVPLLAIVAIFAGRMVAAAPLEPFAAVPLTLGNVASAATLTLFALTGFENATAPVGKVRDPARTIPIAILGGTASVALLYLLVSTGVQRLLPAAAVAHSSAPIAEVIALHWGSVAATLAALGIAVAAFGGLNSLILGTGELGYAMALRRDLPAFMARTREISRGAAGASDTVGTPVAAQVLGSALSVILILANASRDTAGLFAFVVLLSTAGALVVYLLGTLAAWRTSPGPGARIVLVVALAFTAFAIYGSGLEADLWCLVLLAIGIGLRAMMHRLHAKDIAAAI